MTTIGEGRMHKRGWARRSDRMVLAIGLLTTWFVSASVAAAAAPQASPHAIGSYGQLPLHFEANQGYLDRQVAFLSRGSGYSLFLTPTEAVVALQRLSAVSDRRSANIDRDGREEGTVLRLRFLGANPSPQIVGLEELPGKTNYFTGNDPNQWRTHVPLYAKVAYQEVYPGIDLVYYGNQRQLEYDLVVRPGADPTVIKFVVKGAESLDLDAQGDLVLSTGGADVRLHKPVVYQEINGHKQLIAGRYVRWGENGKERHPDRQYEVGFEVAAYDATKPLIIDPVLSYSSYLGGNNSDYGSGAAVDTNGNMYVTGQTISLNFPKKDPLQALMNLLGAVGDGGYTDAFVTKLDASGALVYSTYLGGGGTDWGTAIAVDGAGNAYVTGGSMSSNFPSQNRQGSCPDWDQTPFVAKLNATGSALLYSTCYGGTARDAPAAIAVDVAGNAYVTGSTGSVDFPTVNPLQPSNHGDSINRFGHDAFVFKVTPAGSIIYSTYLGGAGSDSGSGIAADSAGNAYVTGSTGSSDFPVMTPWQSARRGADDAFIAKINPTGSALVYSTYLGGSGNDGGARIVIDGAGNVYVAGTTSSTNFPLATPLQPTLGGGIDSFIVKFNSAVSFLIYGTYLGGSGNDSVSGLALDSAGNIYVGGGTNSTNFPTANAQQPTYAGGTSDVFIAKLNATGLALAYATYLGGSSEDGGGNIAVDGTGSVYVTGFTASTNFPIANARQPAYGGGPYDAFVTKLTFVVAPTADAGSDQSVNERASVTLDGSASRDPNGDALTYQWRQVAGAPVSLNLADPVYPVFTAPAVPVGGATLTFELVVNDGQLDSAPDVVNVTVVNVNTAPVADAGGDQVVREGSTVTLDGTASYDPDGETLSYQWQQTAGSAVVLSNSMAAQPIFIAPLTGRTGSVLTFTVTVSDGFDSSTASVTITVQNVNHPPAADAGPNQTKDEQTVVTLDGTASADPDGDPVSYIWTQLQGPSVLLSGATSPAPTFTAPSVGPGGATLQFQLVVHDGLASSAPAQVTVMVRDLNDPPVCHAAQASPSRLWPPNHKLVPVVIGGVADPNNNHVTIAVTRVTQDEPVNGRGDGDTSPDAVLQGATVLLRAERAKKIAAPETEKEEEKGKRSDKGRRSEKDKKAEHEKEKHEKEKHAKKGNGRVYEVHFTADDGQGGTCSGAVKVGVPPNKRPGSVAVDDGQVYNSLTP